MKPTASAVIVVLVMAGILPGQLDAKQASTARERELREARDEAAALVRYSGPVRAQVTSHAPRAWQPRGQLAGTYHNPYARYAFVRDTAPWYPPYGYGWYGWYGRPVYVAPVHCPPLYAPPIYLPPPIHGPPRP